MESTTATSSSAITRKRKRTSKVPPALEKVSKYDASESEDENTKQKRKRLCNKKQTKNKHHQ